MFSMAGERRWNPAWTVNEAPVVRWGDLHGPCRLHNTTVLGKRAPVEVILANPTSEQWCRVGVLVTVHLVAKYTYRMMSDWPCVSALVGSCLRRGCSTSRTRTSQSLSVEHSSPRSSTRCISTRSWPIAFKLTRPSRECDERRVPLLSLGHPEVEALHPQL